jgi:hypothetical protein
MALSVSTQVNPVGAKLIIQTDAEAAADNNITGAGNVDVYMIEIDNRANGGQAEYLKLYNHASPTVGTTPPDMVIMAIGGADITMVFPVPIRFGTALSMACTQEAGTGGTTNPTASVIVRLVTS